jgi:hypothetical protein
MTTNSEPHASHLVLSPLFNKVQVGHGFCNEYKWFIDEADAEAGGEAEAEAEDGAVAEAEAH